MCLNAEALTIIYYYFREKPFMEADLNSQLSYNKRIKFNHIKFPTVSEPILKNRNKPVWITTCIDKITNYELNTYNIVAFLLNVKK